MNEAKREYNHTDINNTDNTDNNDDNTDNNDDNTDNNNDNNDNYENNKKIHSIIPFVITLMM